MNNERIILEMLDRIKILEDELKQIKIDLNLNKKYKSNTNIGFKTTGKKDSTKYIFNGVRYCKNRLVFAVVKEYIKQNPKITTSELESVFDYSLQGNRNHGVIKRKEDAIRKKRDIGNSDEHIEMCYDIIDYLNSLISENRNKKIRPRHLSEGLFCFLAIVYPRIFL